MERLARIIAALEGATRDPDSPLHFTPVPLRARLDGWTPDRQRLFVAALAATGHFGQAAAWVGMTEQTARRLWRREGAASFTAACAAACALAKRMRRRMPVEGSKGAERFSPMGPSPLSTFAPSTASCRGGRMPTQAFPPRQV